MATSNQWSLDPYVYEYIEEAFERVGVESTQIDADKIRSALRSVFLFTNAYSGWLEPQAQIISFQPAVMTEGQEFFELPAEAVDIISMRLLRSTSVTPINRMSRDDFRNLARPELSGRPYEYYLDREYSPLRVYPYLRPNAGDIIKLDYLRRPQDVGFGNTMELEPHWHEAWVASLAEKLAEKFAPERLSEKVSLARIARRRAKTEERSGGDIRFRAR